MLGLVSLAAPPLIIKLLLHNNELNRYDVFAPTLAPANIELISILWHARAPAALFPRL